MKRNTLRPLAELHARYLVASVELRAARAKQREAEDETARLYENWLKIEAELRDAESRLTAADVRGIL